MDSLRDSKYYLIILNQPSKLFITRYSKPNSNAWKQRSRARQYSGSQTLLTLWNVSLESPFQTWITLESQGRKYTLLRFTSAGSQLSAESSQLSAESLFKTALTWRKRPDQGHILKQLRLITQKLSQLGWPYRPLQLQSAAGVGWGLWWQSSEFSLILLLSLPAGGDPSKPPARLSPPTSSLSQGTRPCSPTAC